MSVLDDFAAELALVDPGGDVALHTTGAGMQAAARGSLACVQVLAGVLAEVYADAAQQDGARQ